MILEQSWESIHIYYCYYYDYYLISLQMDSYPMVVVLQ
jgi:hypothetical protein